MCELVKEGVTHGNLCAHNVLAQSLDPVHVKVRTIPASNCPVFHDVRCQPDQVSPTVPRNFWAKLTQLELQISGSGEL